MKKMALPQKLFLNRDTFLHGISDEFVYVQLYAFSNLILCEIPKLLEWCTHQLVRYRCQTLSTNKVNRQRSMHRYNSQSSTFESAYWRSDSLVDYAVQQTSMYSSMYAHGRWAPAHQVVSGQQCGILEYLVLQVSISCRQGIT